MIIEKQICHLCLLFALILHSVCSCFAIGAGPALEALHPPVAARGQDCVIVAKGASLKEACEVLIPNRYVECVGLHADSEEEVRLRLRVHSDCPLGAIPLRIRTPKGVSEIRTLTISPFPVSEIGIKIWNSKQGPQTLLGTFAGKSSESFDLEIQANEILSAEIHAVRLGINLTDTKLTLMSEDGRILLRSDDAPITQQDPIFCVRAKQSCRLKLEVAAVGGGVDTGTYYALHLGNFPRPHSVFPLGVDHRTGAELNLCHLPILENPWVSSQPNHTIQLETCRPSLHGDSIEIVRDGVSCPSPIPFRSTPVDYSVVATPTIDDNREPLETVQVIHEQVPFAVDGVLNRSTQDAKLEFVAVESGPLAVEVFASRYGSLLDPVLEVQDSNGATLARADDVFGHDPKVEFQAEAKGKYRLIVSDKRSQTGHFYSYRIEVARPVTSESIFLARRNKQSQARQTLDVPSGNRILCVLGTKKLDESLGTRIQLEGLPRGLHYECGEELTGTTWTPIVMDASLSSSVQGGFLSVTGTLVRGSETIRSIPFLQSVDLVAGPADSIFQETSLRQLAYSVTEPIPFRVELEEPTQELAVDGTLGIKVRVHREESFLAPIDVSIPLLPEWVDAPDKIQIAPNESEGTIFLRSFQNVKPMRWSLVAEASVGVARKSDTTERPMLGNEPQRFSTSPLDYPTVCSALTPLVIGTSPCRGSLPDIATEQGAEIAVACDLDFDMEENELFKATLEGLPNRVAATPIVVRPGMTQIRFVVKLEDDAPLGMFNGLVCRVQGKREGQDISFCIGRGSQITIHPKGMLRTDSSGRVLTPLEVLKQKNVGSSSVLEKSP